MGVVSRQDVSSTLSVSVELIGGQRWLRVLGPGHHGSKISQRYRLQDICYIEHLPGGYGLDGHEGCQIQICGGAWHQLPITQDQLVELLGGAEESYRW